MLLTHHFVGSDLPKLGEEFLQLLVSHLFCKVLDEDIGELLGLFSELLLALLAGNKSTEYNFIDLSQQL